MWQREVMWCTVHKPTGRAVVTGPRDGLWNHLAIEANPHAKWNDLWCGWTLDNLNQVSDLCTLAHIHDVIYMERDWAPGMVPNRIKKRKTPKKRKVS